MSALDHCVSELVDIAGVDGTFVSVGAWRNGVFAAHLGVAMDEGRWVVTHLPSGAAIPAYFDDPASAAEAMQRLLPLHADWANITRAERTRIRDEVLRVIADCGGKNWLTETRSTVGDGWKKLNGYGAGDAG